MLTFIGDCVDARTNLLFETTLATLTYVKKISSWQKEGYAVGLVYLRLPSVEMSIERVRRRVVEGGHGLPEATIRRRFPKSVDYFEGSTSPSSTSGTFGIAWRKLPASREVGRLMARIIDVNKGTGGTRQSGRGFEDDARIQMMFGQVGLSRQQRAPVCLSEGADLREGQMVLADYRRTSSTRGSKKVEELRSGCAKKLAGRKKLGRSGKRSTGARTMNEVIFASCWATSGSTTDKLASCRACWLEMHCSRSFA